MRTCLQTSRAWDEGATSSATVWLAFALGAATCAGAEEPSAPPGARDTLRLGFSYSMFIGVNENDAKASIKALGTTMVRERGIPAEPEPYLLSGTDAIATAARTGEVDAFSVTTEEYWVLAREVGFDRFVMAVKNGDPTEQYLLLVHRASGVTELAGLRGKRLAVFQNSRMSLGKVWLEVALAKAGQPLAAEHFGSVIDQPKLSKAVLEVFFRQTDACLVSRRGFATMSELNPQVGTQLVALATSPALVPAVFPFRTDFNPTLKEKSLREMSLVHTTAAGQQALMIFQVGQVAERPATDLASALALLDDYVRLRPQASAAHMETLRHKQRMNSGSPRP